MLHHHSLLALLLRDFLQCLSNGDMDHVPEMARDYLVLETLLKLTKEENPETRRNGVVTIFNVACSDQNKVRLI